MRTAGIDVGTNTLRLLIAEVDSGNISPILRDREIIGLGRNLKKTGEFEESEIESAVAVLKRFRKKMEEMRVNEYFAVGTQALRESRNAAIFIDRMKKEAGISIEVIEPDKEATLTSIGIKTVLPPEKTRGALMVDIGGGSTEFILNRSSKMKYETTPLGVVYLLSLFPISDPPEKWEITNLRLFVRSRLEEVKRRLGVRKASKVVGTAGTYTTLAAIKLGMEKYEPAAINGTTLSREEIRSLEETLLSVSSEERLKINGMEKGREHLIVPGVIVASETMEEFRSEETIVSDGSILEGIVLSLGRKYLKGVEI